MTDKELLQEIAAQLRTWALFSREYGYSTHQVDPQRKLADKIDEHIYGSGRRRVAAGKKFGDNEWETY